MDLWKKAWVRWVLIIIAVIVLWNCFFVLPETEMALVTLFGKPARERTEAGLYWKLPIESLIRFEKRIMVYNPRPSEFLTRDKKNLVLESDVLWRIENPTKFLQTVGDVVAAEMRVHDIVWAALRAEVGRVELSDLVSIEPARVKTDQVMGNVSESSREKCAQDYGIAVVDVQLKRLNFPDQNKNSVFARMRAERERIAKQYRAEGEEQALKIRAEADKQKEILLAEAYRDAEKLKGHGDAESTRIYGRAYSRDPEFYKLVRTLESYKKILDEKTNIIMSSDSELLKLLTQGGAKIGSR